MSEFQIVMAVACCPFRDFTTRENTWCDSGVNMTMLRPTVLHEKSVMICQIYTQNSKSHRNFGPRSRFFPQVFMLLEKSFHWLNKMKEFQGCASLNWLLCAILPCLFSDMVCVSTIQYDDISRDISFSKLPLTSKTFTWNQNCSKGRNHADVYLIALYNIIWRTLGGQRKQDKRNCLVLKTDTLPLY